MRFEDAMRISGLRPVDVVADGAWHRCRTDDHPKKKNGVWKLELDGRRGYYRNWADGLGVQVWTEDSGTSLRAPTQRELLRQAELRERQRSERLQAIGRARELFARGATYSPHKYLVDKGLSVEGCHVLRLWHGAVSVDGEHIEDTWLLAPLYWRERLVNVQRIGRTGIKRQLWRAPQKACCLVLDRPRWALTVICEGLATGLAIYQSVRHARVVVAFFADNLLPVVQELKPTGSVVIAADNDFKTAARGKGNPGVEKALNAADLIGCGVAYPSGIEGTDWADFLVEQGQGAARRIDRAITAHARYVAAAPVG